MPATFELAPGDQQVVETQLTLPPGAMDGRYSGLLVAEIVDGDVTGSGGAGARVGAAAGARLDFDVAPASLLSGWLNALRRWYNATAPWSQIGLLGAAVAVLLAAFFRHFQVRVVRVSHQDR